MRYLQTVNASTEDGRGWGNGTRAKAFAIAVGISILAPAVQAAAAKCVLGKVADLPITMNSLRPTIGAKINGRDAQFLLDSGAFYSMISAATAAEYGLKSGWGSYSINGVGGTTEAHVTTVKDFSFIGTQFKNVEFLVGGGEVGNGNAGLLGQNLLEKFDVEYDLMRGVIRLFKTDGCDNARLAYWAGTEQAFSEMSIDRIDPRHPHTVGTAYIDGQKIRVELDSGAFMSMLSLKAAQRAGIRTDSPGVVAAGYSRGIGRATVATYIAAVASFKIGDGEEIKNTRLRIADIDATNADMLLGADFLVSHRIFVANKEHKFFLTYNGGPVFNLSQGGNAPGGVSPRGETSVQAATPAADSAPPAADSAPPSLPADAAELARLGSALAARRDFAPAIADLSKAVELSPNEPEYYYQRANAYRANAQGELALADYERVITLRQEFLPAYIPRAELQLADNNVAAAGAGLDTVDRLAPKQADLRLLLAELLVRMNRLPAAIDQYGLWMDSHRDDSRMATALAGRCLSKALQNQDLDGAMSDCNAALRRTNRTNLEFSSQLYADRGLVRLRLGDYGKAIADCNEALRIFANNARALYARGIAESRIQKDRESVADVTAAQQIAPKIASRFDSFGITPLRDGASAAH